MTLPTGDNQLRPDPGFDFFLAQQSAPILPKQPSGPGGMRQRPRGKKRRTRVDTRSLALPIIGAVLAVAVVVGAGLTWLSLVQASEDQVRADSAAMCSDLAATPGVLNQPGFGWPTDGANLTATLESMTAYRDRWTALAATAAPTIEPDVAAVANAATAIVEGIAISKTIDRPGTLAQMQSVTTATAIVSWVDKYCA